jgi:uncharacterized protein
LADLKLTSMTGLANEVLSAVLQVVVFTLIPFIVFLFRRDRTVSFKEYIGFTTPPAIAVKYAIACSLIFVVAGISLVFIDEGFRQIVTSPVSVTGKIRAMGPTAEGIFILLMMALVKTSLSEEIFFRGFISKRLIAMTGFATGNILQSLTFGLVHLVLIYKLVETTMTGLIVIFVFSSLAGWFIGLIKERYGRGSIIPGWIAHGLGNTISYSVIAFII